MKFKLRLNTKAFPNEDFGLHEVCIFTSEFTSVTTFVAIVSRPKLYMRIKSRGKMCLVIPSWQLYRLSLKLFYSFVHTFRWLIDPTFFTSGNKRVPSVSYLVPLLLDLSFVALCLCIMAIFHCTSSNSFNTLSIWSMAALSCLNMSVGNPKSISLYSYDKFWVSGNRSCSSTWPNHYTLRA